MAGRKSRFTVVKAVGESWSPVKAVMLDSGWLRASGERASPAHAQKPAIDHGTHDGRCQVVDFPE